MMRAEGIPNAPSIRRPSVRDSATANPLLVKTNMGAGHGGASGRYDALRETAFTYAFILWQMGLTGTAPTTESRRF